MLDMPCDVANDQSADPNQYQNTAVLPIPGENGFTLAVTSDMQGCTALASAMFAVEPVEVDSEMINDTLAELANMAAGQLKGIMHLSNSLGLPVVILAKEFAATPTIGEWVHFPLRAGKATVLLSITTQSSVAEEYTRK
jgi:CheY-specific phosphatase CheX